MRRDRTPQHTQPRMARAEEEDAISARRALLRQQTELLGGVLPWLSDPDLIPASAAGAGPVEGDTCSAAFSLAGWMLIEIIQAADGIRHELAWQDALDRYRVAPHLQDRVWRAVLDPASRHAPGLFAMAEFVSVVPWLAAREGVPRERWRETALRTQRFAAKLSRNGSWVQVLIRCYLSKQGSEEDGRGIRTLDPALLCLDDDTGIDSVTPFEDLLAGAKAATARHLGPPQGICVALQAAASGTPDGVDKPTMFGAIWSSFVTAAERLVFPAFDVSRADISAPAPADPYCAEALDRLASSRRDTLRHGPSAQASATAEMVVGNLLGAARGRP